MNGATDDVWHALSLPTGTVTFLFTDIEGSTTRWEHHPDAMKEALAWHDAVLREAIEASGGHVFKTVGDAFCAAFQTAAGAVRAALAAQRALHAEAWADVGGVRVRMALHTDAAEERDNDYFGPAVNRVARLLSAGHGGQILLSRATEELVRDHLSAEISLRDLGERRLKDLIRPEHIFQVLAPDLPTDFPPLKTLDSFPNNLPIQLTSFVGREEELSEISQAIGTTQLLTLIGMGGLGKTRLSLQVAAGLLDQFPDGVWFVELAPVTDPTLVPQAVALAMGVREEPSRPLPATLADTLRDQQVLLVLDNCEHVAEAAARLAETLLRQCARLRILATSRETLGISGETLYRVSPLALPDARRVIAPDELMQYTAVRLFVDRAAAVKPDFAVTDQNAPALAEICRRLDGIPLALELAAARVKVLTVDQIAVRLEDRFRLLTGGSRTALPRQQTLRALIDWSYDLLSEQERAVLRRLAVFAGGFSLEATESVVAGDGVDEFEVLDLLTQLVDKSLVQVEEYDGDVPYRMLETVRQYAEEKLREAGEAEDVRGRHRDWYLALAARVSKEIRGPDQRRWLRRLEREHDNLRVALTRSLEQPEADEQPAEGPAALQLAVSLAPFWYTHGHLSEGRRWLEQALAVSSAAPPSLWARALNSAALLAMLQGDYTTAHSRFEECLRLCRELGDTLGVAKAFGNLGAVAARQGDYAAARPLQEEGLALFRQIGDTPGVVVSLLNLGDLAQKQDDFAAAQSFLDEALPLAQQAGDTWSVLVAHLHLGDVAWRQGGRATARTHFGESLALARDLEDTPHIGRCLVRLGWLLAQGQPEQAARVFGHAEALHEAIGASLPAAEQAEAERHVAVVRAALDELTFAAAWAAGRAMTLAQAIACALEDTVPV
jgi:predicted ATPase/class 3 adenylate cyclase